MPEKSDKAFRLLRMNERLTKGESVVKDTILTEFGIPTKTFQRDINSLRLYYAKQCLGELVYDRKRDCYRLMDKVSYLTKEEVFAVCKILIESRAFNKAEFNDIITKLLWQCETVEAKEVRAVIENERFYYTELQHGKSLMPLLWQLAETVREQAVIEINYKRSDGTIRKHQVKPVGIMFSEFYFYLIAFMTDDSKLWPATFRVDRIDDIKRTEQRFNVQYTERFSESEFRKRVQFMYAGELKVVRFIFKGVLEVVLDRLPTAKIEKETADGVIIRAEVYGDGVDMWLRSQGEKVEIL